MKEAIFHERFGGKWHKRICSHIWTTDWKIGGQEEIIITDVPTSKIRGYTISLAIWICAHCELRELYIFRTWKDVK